VVVTAEELLTLLPLVRRTADAISREYSGAVPGSKEATTKAASKEAPTKEATSR
jgi:hypothetical protein